MRKSRTWLILFLLILLFPQPMPVGRAMNAPELEQVILQQHFTQKELERNLEITRNEEKTLLTQIAQLDSELSRQALIIDAKRRHAGEVARAYYMGKRADLLALLFETDNFNDFLLAYDFLQILFTRDMEKMQDYQTERQKAAQLQQDKQQRLTQVRTLRAHYESQLAEMLAIQKEKEENLQKLTDPTSVQSLMDHLVEDWRKDGLPAFRDYFAILTKVMFEIPELATPDRIHAEGLLTHTLTIKETDFNQFLESKNAMFKQSQFHFENNQLQVEGSYNQMNMKMIGEYQLVSPTELKFHIIQLFYDGFQLPQSTVDELAKEFDLGFYPTMISPNIQVEDIKLADQALTLKIKLDLPFGFGSKQ
ncbi:coiled-coil domain-containing protein [Brevibacillus fluminis]|uniref:coiled-coil domain-containing protein n=1 Tax=Brevibacillus fluminis TaxID=511487 RepID=UPI003F8C0EE5